MPAKNTFSADTKYMEENSEIDFCFTDENYIDGNGKILPSSFYDERTKHIVESDDWNFMALADYYHMVSNLPFSSCFIKKECFENIFIDFTVVMMFDMSIFLQFLLNDKNIGFIKETLVSYRIHEGQVSSSANLKKCTAMSFFEHLPFFRIFFETENVRALQRLLNRNDLSSLVSLRIELAKFCLTLPVVTFQIAAYEWLHEYFQHEENRSDDKYTIAQFRNEYRHSELAYRCLSPSSAAVGGMGIKGVFKILVKKCIRKVFPHKKEKLTHL